MAETQDRFQAGERISWISTLGNLALVAFKLVAGLVGHSAAMVADATHSASDILATLGVIVSLRVSKRPPDDDHPYGHGKAEPAAARLVGIILLLAGGSIAWSALKMITKGSYEAPGTVALIAAVVSIVTKEAMFQATAVVARRIHSSALMAEAWHHRSDAFSSVGTCIGIFAARRGFPVLDPLAGLAVAAFILKMGWKTMKMAGDELMDAQADAGLLQQIEAATMAVDGVHDIHTIAARRYGGSYYVDLRIGVDPGLTVVEGHDIAVKVQEAIKSACQQVVGVLVHIDPETVHQGRLTADLETP